MRTFNIIKQQGRVRQFFSQDGFTQRREAAKPFATIKDAGACLDALRDPKARIARA